LVSSVEKIGKKFLDIVYSVGDCCCFFVAFLKSVLFAPLKVKSLIKQMHNLGSCSLWVILVSGVFVGLVVAVQGFNTLEKFGAEAQLSQLLALSVFRELGPVISALLFAGRAGSAVAAEIGLMQVTEQIPAMEVMAIDPLNKIILPRWVAGIISLPLLMIVFSTLALIGGYLISVFWLHVDGGVFWSNMQASVSFNEDFLNGVYKSFIFGLIINWIALYQGFVAIPNASGVAKATTKTVVISSLLVLLLDFILTAFMFGD
jgi:phospholipid/cholesterol/gamma-HCH transport system permease protein